CRRKPAMAALLLVLAGATGVSSYLAVRTVQAEKRANADRDKALAAERAAQESVVDKEAIGRFLMNEVLETGLARQNLGAAEQKVGETFAGKPRMEAKARAALGMAYLSVDPAAAIRQLERALALFRANLGPDHPDTLICRNNLIKAYQVSGQWTQALPLFEE